VGAVSFSDQITNLTVTPLAGVGQIQIAGNIAKN
jgi:hypothetical protein